MTPGFINKQICLSAAALIAVIALFYFSDLDLAISAKLYDPLTHSWPICIDEPIKRLLLYDGFKRAFICGCSCALIACAILYKSAFVQVRKKGLIVFSLSVALVPSLVGALKNLTEVPCPCEIVNFGGIYPDIKAFDAYPADFTPPNKAKCWPAEHAKYGLFADELIFRLPRHSHAQNRARRGNRDRLDYGRIQDATGRSFFQPYARYNDLSVACDLADREVKPICELVNLKFKTSLPSTYRFVISLARKVRYMKRNILVKFEAEF